MNIRKDNNYNNWWIDPYLEAVNLNIKSFQQEWAKRFGEEKVLETVDKEYIFRLSKKIGINVDTFYYSIGTLGGGNHFIELGESTNDGSHYLTIHSGSLNLGLKVCNYHAKRCWHKEG